MRIGLYNGTTLYPLAGEDGVSDRVHSSAADFALTPESALQVSFFVRAVHAKPIDRGNLLNSITFTTTRKFDSAEAASLWALDYDAAFPRSGTLYFDTLAGSYIVRREMANAVVSPPVRRVIGASVLLEYRAQGGAISAPTAYPDIEVTGTLTSDGSTPVTFPVLRYAGLYNGKPVYTNNGLTSGMTHSISWEAAAWVLGQLSPLGFWQSLSDVATPDLATGWAAVVGTGTPVIAIA